MLYSTVNVYRLKYLHHEEKIKNVKLLYINMYIKIQSINKIADMFSTLIYIVVENGSAI
jgi:hypothetical protein